MRAKQPDKVLKVMRANGWLRDHAPEIDRLYGVPQNAEHHPEIDTGIHIELSLAIVAQLSEDPRARYAALVHDLGKALTPKEEWPRHLSHEELGVRPGLRLGKRLGVPKDWRLLGALVARYHLRVHRALELSPRSLVRIFRDSHFFERSELLEPFLCACEADARGRAGLQDRPYPQADRLRLAFKAASAAETVGNEDIHDARIRLVARALRESR